MDNEVVYISEEQIKDNYKKALEKAKLKPVKLIFTSKRESGDPKQKMTKDVMGYGAAAQTYKKEAIYVDSDMLNKKYKFHIQESKYINKKPLSVEEFTQWKLLHEQGHIEKYRKDKRVYENIGSKVGKKHIMTGLYEGEREASFLAHKYIPNIQLLDSTLSGYSKNTGDDMDYRRQIRKVKRPELREFFEKHPTKYLKERKKRKSKSRSFFEF